MTSHKMMGMSVVVCLLLFFTLIFLQSRPDGVLILEENPEKNVVDSATSCFSSECHDTTGGSFNSVGSLTLSGLPDSFVPGESYDLQVRITGGFVYGTMIAAVYADGSQAGSLTAATAGIVKRTISSVSGQPRAAGPLDVLLHSPDPLLSGTVNFSWTAPDPAAGPVTFRVASNSANFDGAATGDAINIISETLAAEEEGEVQVFYFPQVADAHLTAADLILILVSELNFHNAGADTTLKIEFFDSAGEPLEFTLGELGTESVFENIPLPSGSTLTVSTPGTEEGLRFGYARVTTGTGVGATAVFKRSQSSGGESVLLTEAGVPATDVLTDFSVILDSLGDADIGLAMVNSGASEAVITISLRDSQFELIDSLELRLGPGEHVAKFIWEFFRDAGKAATAEMAQEIQAIVTVGSSEELAAVTLRQNDRPGLDFPLEVPTLTSFEVLPGRGEVAP